MPGHSLIKAGLTPWQVFPYSRSVGVMPSKHRISHPASFFQGASLFFSIKPHLLHPLPSLPRPMAAGLRHLRSPGWIKPGSALAAHTHNTTARTHTVSHHQRPIIWIIPQYLLGNVFCFELPRGKVSFRLHWWKSSCVTWRLNARSSNVVIRSPHNSELDAEIIQNHHCF